MSDDPHWWIHTVFDNEAEANKGKTIMQNKATAFKFRVGSMRVWESVEQVKEENRL